MRGDLAHALRRMFGRWKRGGLRIEPWQRTLYTIAFAEMIAILGFGISGPFLPFYIEELGVRDLNQVAFWVGIINSAAPIAMAVTSPIWGLLADRHGRKPMLLRAMFGGAVILSLIAMAGNVAQVTVLRVLQGAVTGTISAATVLVATTVPRERCGYSLGLLQTAVFIGNSLGPSLGGLIGGTLGYRAAFLGSGILLAGAGIMVAALVQERFVPSPRPEHAGNPFAAPVRAILNEPLILAMLSLLTLTSLSGSVSGPVLPLFVQSMTPTLEAATAATGLILGVTALTNALAAVWLGRVADRLGRRSALLACLGVAALVYFPHLWTTNATQLLFLRAVLGFAMGGIAPIANAVVAERSPEGQQGGVFGISTSLNAVGNALGPVLGTLVVTQWSLAAVFPVTGALMAGVVVLVALTTRTLVGARPRAIAPAAGKTDCGR